MATPTYIPLATTTLTASAASVTFGSIPQDYRDLVLVIDGGMPSSNGEPFLRPNSDSGTNFSVVTMSATGTVTPSSSFSANRLSLGFTFGTGKTSIISQLMDYSATDKHKTNLARCNQTTGRVSAFAARWADTSAVTNIQVLHEGGSYPAGVTFSLYGIAS